MKLATLERGTTLYCRRPVSIGRKNFLPGQVFPYKRLSFSWRKVEQLYRQRRIVTENDPYFSDLMTTYGTTNNKAFAVAWLKENSVSFEEPEDNEETAKTDKIEADKIEADKIEADKIEADKIEAEEKAKAEEAEELKKAEEARAEELKKAEEAEEEAELKRKEEAEEAKIDRELEELKKAEKPKKPVPKKKPKSKSKKRRSKKSNKK